MIIWQCGYSPDLPAFSWWLLSISCLPDCENCSLYFTHRPAHRDLETYTHEHITQVQLRQKFVHTLNWEVEQQLTELKPPEAPGSSSAQLSNEGHSCTSARHRCFTGTIKPEPALPWSAHTVLSHRAAPQSLQAVITLLLTLQLLACFMACLFLPHLRLLSFLLQDKL